MVPCCVCLITMNLGTSHHTTTYPHHYYILNVIQREPSTNLAIVNQSPCHAIIPHFYHRGENNENFDHNKDHPGVPRLYLAA